MGEVVRGELGGGQPPRGHQGGHDYLEPLEVLHSGEGVSVPRNVTHLLYPGGDRVLESAGGVHPEDVLLDNMTHQSLGQEVSGGVTGGSREDVTTPRHLRHLFDGLYYGHSLPGPRGAKHHVGDGPGAPGDDVLHGHQLLLVALYELVVAADLRESGLGGGEHLHGGEQGPEQVVSGQAHGAVHVPQRVAAQSKPHVKSHVPHMELTERSSETNEDIPLLDLMDKSLELSLLGVTG